MPITLSEILPTDILRGEVGEVEQGVRLTIAGLRPGAEVEGRAGGGLERTTARDDGSAVLLAFAPQPASSDHDHDRELEIVVTCEGETASRTERVAYGEPGWTLHLVPHFHFDPVWWNTQAAFISEWENLPVAMEAKMVAAQMTAFDLMRAHLRRAEEDADYRFVVAELDYLKPWWDSFPEERDLLRRLIRERRVEVTGGSYNEPSSTLISAEAAIRNAIAGLGFQRGVLGADPTTAWQLDVFGHDAHYPAIMAAAGLTRSSWARGPFHEWGPMAGGSDGVSIIQDRDPAMQFDQEFEWMAPNGRGLLTSYQAAHYHAGWWMDGAETLEDAESQIYDLFRHLTTASATKHVLLLVGTDHVRPNRWVTDIHRDWAARYSWPRFVVGTPSDYFEAVEAELAAGRGRVTTQTRDMNPVFAGTAVSFADTKQAHRAAEVALVEAEKFATLAWARGLGGAYPEAEIEHAWRQLSFASHHDAITGSESDQVYIDLLGLWRGAWTTARDVRDAAQRALLSAREVAGDLGSVTVFNGMSSDRVDVARATLVRRPGTVRDADGVPVPAVVTGSDDTGWTLALVAEVPATGYATFSLDAVAPWTGGWGTLDGTTIANTHLSLTIDPRRGGTVSSLRDLATDTELLSGSGNEILVYEEYPDHPVFKGLGPWHITPTGREPERSSGAIVHACRAESSAAGQRLVVEGRLGSLSFTQTLTLWAGMPRVDAETRIDFDGADRLVRIAWPCDLPGTLPVAQVAGAVIGRGVAHPGTDTAAYPWAMDSTCHEWFGLSAPARIRLVDPAGGPVWERAIAVAEIVSRDLDESADLGRELARALVRCGVTSTNSLATGPRYGDLDKDSNQPDLRIVLGTPETNPFLVSVLAASHSSYAERVRRAAQSGGAVLIPARPGAEPVPPGAPVTGPVDLPVLVITGDVRAAVAGVVADLEDACIELAQDVSGLPPSSVTPRSAAIVNRGTPGYLVEANGTLHLSALRSSTGWPSGVWIDPPTRTTPDGSAFQLQHWTHVIEYALLTGEGDWRDASFGVRARAFAQPFTTVVESGSPRPAAARASLLSVDPPTVQAGVVKRGGHPTALRSRAADDLVIRLWETDGRDAVATLGLGVGEPSAARLTDLLEQRDGDPVLEGGVVRVPVGGFDLETVRVTVGDRPPVSTTQWRSPGFSRYWLHNGGPAGVGDQPVSVRLLGRGVEDGRLHLDVQLASEIPDARIGGRLRVETIPPTAVARQLDIAEVGEARLERLELDLEGVTTTTVVATFVGRDGFAAYDVAAFDADGERITARTIADAVQLVWTRASYEVAPGSATELAVEVRNTGRFELLGDLQLLTPWGSWSWIDDWAHAVRVPAGESRVYRTDASPPPGSPPAATWAIAKLGALGAVAYSPTVPLVVGGR
jgi:alpha-mannosidase